MINLKSISWDLETYSSVDLTKCGVYRYCESEDFEILLAAYSIDGGGGTGDRPCLWGETPARDSGCAGR